MQHFSSDGVDIAYVDVAPTMADRGEPIVLVHGFASNHAVNWLNTLWVRTLTHDGRRVIALDNRGHGHSAKPHNPSDYDARIMAADVARLMDHLDIPRADVMGYSMGARITAYLALQHPERVRTAILGGLGDHLVDGVGLPLGIADAMEAPSLQGLSDPMQRMFRAFAEATGSDLAALAACIRGSRQTLTRDDCAAIRTPTLICIGTNDHIAGDAHALAALIPGARALDIPGRDHNLAVGDKVFKQGVLAFLAEQIT